MIYRLEIENFSCFREPQILDLSVSRIPEEYRERFAPIFRGARLSAPKGVFIYGANASGKSTLLKVLAHLVGFVQENPGEEPAPWFYPFEGANMPDQPICLAIEFGGITDLGETLEADSEELDHMPRGTYRYELEVSRDEGAQLHVNREVLRHRPNGVGKWKRVFERKEGEKTLGSKTFPLSGYSQVLDVIPNHASVIGTLAVFDHKASQALVKMTREVFSNIYWDRLQPDLTDLVKIYQEDSWILEHVNEDLQRFDTGIEEMSVIQAPDGPHFAFKHTNLPTKLRWSRESSGTRSFIQSFPQIHYAYVHGGVAVVDEMDSCIHPSLLPKILRWFHDPIHNPFNGQLWATCHSAPLMEYLSKEEIVLCEKDGLTGQASTYCLKDVRPIRKDENFYKNYLGGAYGGIPCVG